MKPFALGILLALPVLVWMQFRTASGCVSRGDLGKTEWYTPRGERCAYLVRWSTGMWWAVIEYSASVPDKYFDDREKAIQWIQETCKP